MSLKYELGFAMLEVLVAMLVMMFGVLGIAGMQMMAINNTETARYQSIAAMLTSGMAAKMQANAAFWGAPPQNISVAGSAVSGVPSSSASCIAASCTAPQMAYYDLQTWGATATAVLPSGQGAITCNPSVPAVCTLTLSWSEKNIALSNPTNTETGMLASGKASTHNYQTMVAIQQ